VNDKKTFLLHPMLMVLGFSVVLRFWNFFEIPFTHDEYSSLRRAQYCSFHELIEEGVSHDTHPPLGQIFYFFWVKLGGTAEWWVKLPFLLMGVFSVGLVYLIARRWFGNTSALISSSFIAVFQESVMHSQIARPYSLGLFFILLSTFALQKIVASPEKWANRWWIIVAAISLSCSALTHHFSMLAGFLLAVFFLVAHLRIHARSLFLTYLISICLYLPNIPILLKQLDMGGIGSILAPPQSSFLLDYIKYIFNYSDFFLAFAALLVVLSIVTYTQKKMRSAFFICVGLFTISFVCGYYYSIHVAPVLHFRALYFVMPFMIMALFSFVKSVSVRLNWILSLVIVLSGAFALVFGRQHYRTFYTDGYGYILNESNDLSQEGNTDVMLCYSPDMLTYQSNAQEVNLAEFTNVDSSWTMRDYVQFVGRAQGDRFVFGYTWQFYRPPLELLGMLYNKYGHMSQHQDYFNSNLFVFDKRVESGNARFVSDSLCDLSIATEVIMPDDSLNILAAFQKENEFGFKISTQVPNDQIQIPDWLIASITVRGNELKDALLVLEVKEDDKQIHYDARNFEQFREANDSVFTVFNALFSPDIFLKGHHYVVNAYVWNRGGRFDVLDFNFIRIKGNPLMYCLDRPLVSNDLDYLPLLE